MESKIQENNIVITELDLGEPFDINGKEYLSKREIYANSEYLEGNCGRGFSIHHHKNGIFVLVFSEGYPCFDSSDYMYENRSYNALFFCGSLDEAIQKTEFLKAKGWLPFGVTRNPEAWEYLCPFVYIDDGEKTFRIYENTSV